jgi:hypothetical protein
MGFPVKRGEKSRPLKKRKYNHAKLKKYYSRLLGMHSKIGQIYGIPAKRVISSILTKGNQPTQTFCNRELGLLDIDKLISFDLNSLFENSKRVEQMKNAVTG